MWADGERQGAYLRLVADALYDARREADGERGEAGEHAVLVLHALDVRARETQRKLEHLKELVVATPVDDAAQLGKRALPELRVEPVHRAVDAAAHQVLRDTNRTRVVRRWCEAALDASTTHRKVWLKFILMNKQA